MKKRVSGRQRLERKENSPLGQAHGKRKTVFLTEILGCRQNRSKDLRKPLHKPSSSSLRSENRWQDLQVKKVRIEWRQSQPYRILLRKASKACKVPSAECSSAGKLKEKETNRFRRSAPRKKGKKWVVRGLGILCKITGQ